MLKQSFFLFSLFTLTGFTGGCSQPFSETVAADPVDDADGRGLGESRLQAAKHGIRLDALLGRLPAEMQENLCHNQLRRSRANEWLVSNIIGATLDHECLVADVAVTQVSDGEFWVRFWLEEKETTILGEIVILSVGPGCSPDQLLFDQGLLKGFETALVHGMIFGNEQANPSHALIKTKDAAFAEELADLRGKTVSLHGAVQEFAFYPCQFDAAGGVRIGLTDTTINGIQTVTSLPVSTTVENPWNIAYEPIPTGADAEALLSDAGLNGSSDDPNAGNWAQDTTISTADSLDGTWSGRWRNGTSREWHGESQPTDIVVRNERLLIRYTDAWGTNLIVLRRIRDNEYVGRYLNTASPAFTSPMAVRVVSPERIDGVWIDDAGRISRWDFRRKQHVGMNESSLTLGNLAEANP